MRFGLALPHYDFSVPPAQRPITFRRTAEVAVRAEALGFDSVWVSDHFLYSFARYGEPEPLYGSLEPLTALAGIAAVTERVRLGTLVLGAPFRHPSLLAKTVAAIDSISEGRIDLGVGAGWLEDEFTAFGYRFGTRGGALRRARGDAAGAGGAARRVRGLGHVRVGRAEVGAPAAAARAAAEAAGVGGRQGRCPGCCGSPRATRTGGTWCGA